VVTGNEKVNAALGVDVEPWARRDKESPVAFEAFSKYREMDPIKRSLASVGRELSKSKQLMSRWSSTWSWVRRARAWDDKVEAEVREEEIKERRKMGKRHAKQSQSFQSILMQPAVALAQAFADKPTLEKFRKDIAKLPVAEALALIRSSASVYPSLVRAERLASGESTENVEGRVGRNQVKAVASRIAARAAKYIPQDKQEAFLNDLKADLENELGE
jgi:hypothetical protein